MKKILVPTDFSLPATNAFHFAVQVAQRIDAQIILLNVISFEFSSFNVGGEVANNPEEMHNHAEYVRLSINKLKRFAGLYPKVDTVTKSKFGEPEDIITSSIQDYDIDLVVMGTHGTSGLKEFFIGSHTQKVIRDAKCPVIAIKDRVDLEQLESITLAFDLDDKGIEAVNMIKSLSEMLNLTLNLAHIRLKYDYSRTVFEVEQDVKSFLQKTSAADTSYQILYADHIEDGIIDAAETMNSGIIAMATHSRQGLMHLLKGSLTESLANHSDKPLMSVSMSQS